jgi:hypothetical protein
VPPLGGQLSNIPTLRDVPAVPETQSCLLFTYLTFDNFEALLVTFIKNANRAARFQEVSGVGSVTGTGGLNFEEVPELRAKLEAVERTQNPSRER